MATGVGFASAPPPKTTHHSFLSGLFGEYHLPFGETVAGIKASLERAEPAPQRDETGLGANDFRHLVEDFHRDQTRHADESRRDHVKQRQARAHALIDAHVFDDDWRQIMHRACEAAEHGEKEFLLLRFPSEFCIDGGRAINVHEPYWPTSLRGEPAEMYLLWERDLKPRGFDLSARLADFPGGKPGDIGLFLVWAK